MRRIIAAFILTALLTFAFGAPRAAIFRGGVTPVSGSPTCDALCQTVSTAGVYTQLVAASGISGVSNLSAHALGTECGDPTTHSSCWCADWDISGTCSGSAPAVSGSGWASLWYNGYLTGDYPARNITFSGAGIRKEDGFALYGGGGHAIGNGQEGGEGSLYGFDPIAAAAALPTGGNWVMEIPGGRLLPNSAGQPAGSQQNDGSCGGTSYWLATANKNGQGASPPQHQYYGIKEIPGTDRKFVIAGTNGGCGTGGSLTGNGGGKIVDVTTGSAALYGTAGSPQLYPGTYVTLDGNWYVGNNSASDANHWYRYTINAGAGSYGITQLGAACSSTGDVTHGDIIAFPDPSAPTTDVDLFATGLLGYATGGSSNLWLLKHLAGVGGATTDLCDTGTVINSGTGFPTVMYAMAYDDDDGSFLFPDYLGHIWKLTINFSNLSSSTFTEVVSSVSGSSPNCSQGSNSGYWISVQYLPKTRVGGGGKGIIEIICDTQVYVTAAP